MTIDGWIPVVVALVMSVPGLLAYLNTRRKASAETADLYTGAAKKLIDALEARLASVTKRMDESDAALRTARSELDSFKMDLARARAQAEHMATVQIRLRAAIAHLREGIVALSAQLEANGLTPSWKPDDRLFTDLDAAIGVSV